MSYDICPAIQLSFNDPLTGLPAAGGKVFFYEDVNRNTLKTVYALSGSPGSYTWVPYETNVDGSVSLDSSGSFNPQLYLYPYDEDGNIDKYYIEAYSSTGGLVYQTENFPDISADAAQIVYLITSAGISPVDLDNPAQVAEAVENYVLSGDFFVDSSDVPNVYVAERESPQGFVLPTQLVDGMKVRFIPGTTNTGASTFTIIGTTNSIVGYRGSTTALTGGQIVEGQDLWLTYDLANTNWYICQNIADYVSAGNYYNDTGTANNIVITSPANLPFANPSGDATTAYAGMRIRVRVLNTNTGPTTLTFLGFTNQVLNPINGHVLSPGQLLGATDFYLPEYEFSLSPNQGWFLIGSPNNYAPVVIQKVVSASASSSSTAADIDNTNPASGALLMTLTFTPKSINSTLLINFYYQFSCAGNGGAGANIVIAGAINNGTQVSTGGFPAFITMCGAPVSNTTGEQITVNIFYGRIAGNSGFTVDLLGTPLLTIEEIIYN